MEKRLRRLVRDLRKPAGIFRDYRSSATQCDVQQWSPDRATVAIKEVVQPVGRGRYSAFTAGTVFKFKDGSKPEDIPVEDPFQ